MNKYFYDFLKPKSLLKLVIFLQKPTLMLSIPLFFMGIYGGLFIVPADYQQGEYARILYIHVPASWGALAIYSCMALFSAVGLITRIPQFFLISKSIAPVGLTYCLISLVTGSLWGKPTWGSFWVWDARLTSMFLLFLLYTGYIQLSQCHDIKKLVPASFLSVIGFINIPIIKGSVEWWYTLHQPATFRLLENKSSLHPSMAWPLWVMTAAYVLYTVYLSSTRMEHLLKQNMKERK